MICVVQRVSSANVMVDTRVVGEIQRGIVVMAAVHRTDAPDDIAWMARKLASMRIFPRGERNFDQDVAQINGSILLVSNFTVAADARKGRRPSLDAAADPVAGRAGFEQLVAAVRALGVHVQTGEFGADMKVTLTNDGPGTFLLDSRDKPASADMAAQ
ncbi:MAG: D-aminoacyl-tRNA deacylase [Planctomycetota bacterium]|nr:D-aminoacyl-tRNA deacylase [Planctomycetota bacterium]